MPACHRQLSRAIENVHSENSNPFYSVGCEVVLNWSSHFYLVHVIM